MKNKGVVISLAAIVLIGMIITTGTHLFIEKNSRISPTQAQVSAEAAAEDGDSISGEGAESASALEERLSRAEDSLGQVTEDGGVHQPAARKAAIAPLSMGLEEEEAFTGEAEPFAAADGTCPESDMEKVPMPAAETDLAADVISPLETTAGSEDVSVEVQEQKSGAGAMAESESYYVKRLQDLDSQIEKTRETQAGTNVNNSLKSAVSNELKLWDSELNNIYNAILDNLGQEESEELVKEERAWLKERDSQAMEAARKSAGGSSESIEYTVSLVESTRQRAYELARRYAQVLEE
ncbi:MAG: DUF1311 domain-containing protein [Hungatella sp.]|nr:DUF1311 domain-containing protein [Hungatella sp.]